MSKLLWRIYYSGKLVIWERFNKSWSNLFFLLNSKRISKLNVSSSVAFIFLKTTDKNLNFFCLPSLCGGLSCTQDDPSWDLKWSLFLFIKISSSCNLFCFAVLLKTDIFVLLHLPCFNPGFYSNGSFPNGLIHVRNIWGKHY